MDEWTILGMLPIALFIGTFTFFSFLRGREGVFSEIKAPTYNAGFNSRQFVEDPEPIIKPVIEKAKPVKPKKEFKPKWVMPRK